MSTELPKKRRLKRVASLLIILSLFASFCVPLAFAAGEPTLVVSSASAAPGANVSVTLSIVNNTTGFAMAAFNVNYGIGLTLVSVEGGDFGPINDYGFYCVEDENFNNIYDDGVIAVFNFLIDDTAISGATISVTAVNDPSMSGGMILDENFDEYCFTATPGTITVTGGTDGGNDDDAAYTISPVSGITSLDVDGTFNVDVVATAADADATLAAIDAVLDYDSALVAPTTAIIKTFDGANSSAELDGSIKAFGDSANVGDGLVVATYTFKALAAGDAVFSIKDGALIGISGDTAETAAASGTPITITINSGSTGGDDDDDTSVSTLISNNTFNAAPAGYQVLRYTSDTLPAAGNAFFYEGDALYYAGQTEDGKNIFLGFVADTLDSSSLAAVTEDAGVYETLDYSGDLNGNTTINSIDALIAYDLSKGIYANDSTMTAKIRFEADVNNDGKVDIEDARAIINK